MSHSRETDPESRYALLGKWSVKYALSTWYAEYQYFAFFDIKSL